MMNMETTNNVANFNSTQLSENESWIAKVRMKDYGISKYIVRLLLPLLDLGG
jgi:hypothetical protein